MAIHHGSASLSIEAIDEYIQLAQLGIAFKKEDGGCLGYPTTLLLFCVIDAISSHLGFEPHSFAALKHPLFGLNLTDDQIERLKLWYRHSLAHNGMIAPGTMLTPESEGAAIEMVDGEPVVLRVIPLLRLVEKAWQDFDKTTVKERKSKQPSSPIDFSVALPFAASGCMIAPKVTKM